jgi:hypothetical protein
MSNTIIGYQNRIDAATFTAYGSWSTSLPLTNIKTRQLSKKARSTNSVNSSTKLRFALDAERIIGSVAIVNHNMQKDATWRYRVYSDSGYSTLVYDSGTLNVWPLMPFGSYEWEDSRFWDLQLSAEEIALFTKTLTFVPSTVASAQYYQIEFFDSTNTDGYVELGRIFVGAIYQPELNMNLGASIGDETNTIVDVALSGAEFFDRRTSSRVAQFTLDHLAYNESIINGDIMKISGTDAEVLYIYDDNTALDLHRRAFLGRLRTLSPIAQPYNTRYQTTYEIKELL